MKLKIKEINELHEQQYYHTIGLTENVYLCGIYVLKGNGNFKIKFIGSDHYASGCPYFVGEEFNEYALITSCCIVFENHQCIHRFIQSQDTKSSLSFIAFYIIHPKQQQCITTADYPCIIRDKYLKRFNKIFAEKSISDLIFQYAFNDNYLWTIQDANKLRQDIIDYQMTNRPKWAFNYQYNNDGGLNSYFICPQYLPFLSYEIYLKCIYDANDIAINIHDRPRYGPLSIGDERHQYDIVEPSDNEVDYYQHIISKRNRL